MCRTSKASRAGARTPGGCRRREAGRVLGIEQIEDADDGHLGRCVRLASDISADRHPARPQPALVTQEAVGSMVTPYLAVMAATFSISGIPAAVAASSSANI